MSDLEAMGEMKERCEICRFVRWESTHNGRHYTCHLNAPRGVKMDNWSARDQAIWPTVSFSDWCGQFQPRDL